MADLEVSTDSLTPEAVQNQNQSGYKIFGLRIPSWRSPLTQGIRNMKSIQMPT